MRTKAIQDLSQYSDAQLFKELEEGLTHCIRNARQIQSDRTVLVDQARVRGARILQLAAQAEAAKVLILLDAVRCPRSRPTEFGRQLQYFNDHLAKGIYAEFCGLRPASFAEVKSWVELERKEFYLDGPNDVDWIYYNDILRRREETIYVDYVASDDKHYWHDPQTLEDPSMKFLTLYEIPAVKLVDALERAGCLSSAALEIIAKKWRGISIEDDLSWTALRVFNHETLNQLEDADLLRKQPDDVYYTIVNEWLFPLYPLNLQKERVDKDELHKIQERWSPY